MKHLQHRWRQFASKGALHLVSQVAGTCPTVMLLLSLLALASAAVAESGGGGGGGGGSSIARGRGDDADTKLVQDHIDSNAFSTYRNASGQLPFPYLVPGGPYEELWDWDSFFTGVALLDCCGSNRFLRVFSMMSGVAL